MSALHYQDGIPAWAAALYVAGQNFVKQARDITFCPACGTDETHHVRSLSHNAECGACQHKWTDHGYGKSAADDDVPVVEYNLVGTLQRSKDWILLSVPNAFVRGVFAAMQEPGIEVPPQKESGALNAHISVMRPEEVEMIGGPDKITERGKQFHYTLGRLYSVEPAGWSEMSKVYMVQVHSPELQALRRSYGLSGIPNEGKFAFHITVAVKRRGVLGRNEVSKAAA